MQRDKLVDDDAPALTAGAVAAQLGVAVSTLRSWSRRYGLGPSHHQPGRHRRYDAADIARLESMRMLVAKGVAPADAAAWVQQHPVGVPSPTSREGARPVSSRLVPDLAGAAYRLDALALAKGLARQLSARGVVSTWDEVCLPLIGHLTRGRDDDGECVEAEHLLSWTISAALHRIPDPPRRPGAPVALLACGPDEWHTLGLDALRAALAERGIAVCMLGAATPDTALVAACERVDPTVVVVWSQTARTARHETLSGLSAALPADRVIVAAGPGWQARRPPSGMVTARTLREAILLTVGASSWSPGTIRTTLEIRKPVAGGRHR